MFRSSPIKSKTHKDLLGALNTLDTVHGPFEARIGAADAAAEEVVLFRQLLAPRLRVVEQVKVADENL